MHSQRRYSVRVGLRSGSDDADGMHGGEIIAPDVKHAIFGNSFSINASGIRRRVIRYFLSQFEYISYYLVRSIQRSMDFLLQESDRTNCLLSHREFS
jgi:hypothetical protein